MFQKFFAIALLKTFFSTRDYADAKDICITLTYQGPCCNGNVHSYSSCSTRDKEFACIVKDGSTKLCSQQFPGGKSAKSLGMTSGFITNCQLVVPDGSKQKPNARLLWLKQGWEVQGSYLSAYAAFFNAFSGSVEKFPKAIFQHAPVFFQIDLLRMKKVVFLVISLRGQSINGRRSFAISYQDVHGKSVVYRKASPYAQDLKCESVESKRDCRFRLIPFRARSIRIVAIDYKRNDRLSLEVFGSDYLDADVQWLLDRVKHDEEGSYFPDEQGDLVLRTAQSREVNWAPDAGIISQANDRFFAKPSNIAIHCYMIPDKCKYGFTIAFWFKVGGENRFSILSTENANAQATHMGLEVIYMVPAELAVSVKANHYLYNLKYAIATAGWYHFVITWSTASGLVLYKNGAKVVDGSKRGQLHAFPSSSDISIGSETVNNGTQLHDLRLWNIKLSGYDATTLFSTGKSNNQTFTENIKKFRPRSCLEALAAYGNKSGIYDIHFQDANTRIRCIPVLNGAKFYIYADESTVNVSQPWAATQFQKFFTYDQSFGAREHLIKHSSKCRQTIKYSCLNVKISSNARPCNKKNAQYKVPCEGGKCSCDALSKHELKHDKQHFEDRLQLPLGRMIINSVSAADSSLQFTVGPVECFEDSHVYVSCKDALDKNGKSRGSYLISTSKNIIKVECVYENSKYLSIFRHSVSEADLKINGFEVAGSFRKWIIYEEDFASIVAIVNASDSCSQEVKTTCYNVHLSQYCWFNDRNGQRIPFWAGGAPGKFCKCKMDNSCHNELPCNCDSNDRVSRRDDGTFTDKRNLPLSAVMVGDTGASNEHMTLRIGSLICIGTGDAGTNEQSECSVRNGINENCTPTTKDYGCSDETDENGCCKFPFTYLGTEYHGCTQFDSRIPWCSLNSTYAGHWRYCVSQLPKADTDFNANTNGDYGDWKIGNDCGNGANSGPCYDAAASSMPSEKASIVTLRHLAVLENYSTYIRATDECRKSQFYGSLKGTITGMRIRIEDSNRPKIIKKAYYAFMFGYVPKVSVIMHIYAVIPPGNSNHYVNQCKFANFRNGVHFGPVVWKLVVKEQSQVNVATPDLKEIITPVLQSKDKSFSTNVYLVFEWKEFQLGQLVKNYNHVMADHFVIEYEDKQTGNYLYADSADSKGPGLPLVYNTQHFPPTKKCLQFWYHMHDVGDSILTVNIYQRDNIAKEILKIVGKQGTNWKKSTVPIKAFLNASGFLFKISFVVIHGPSIQRSIAIDDVSLLDEDCTLMPAMTYSLPDNLPKVHLMCSLGFPLDATPNNKIKIWKVENSPDGIADPFGFPLYFAQFGGKNTAAVLRSDPPAAIPGSLTVCFYIKHSTNGINLAVFTYSQHFSIGVNKLGKLHIKLDSKNGFYRAEMEQVLPINVWNFLCIVYEQHFGVIKFFFDGKLTGEKHVGYERKVIPGKGLTIGASGDLPSYYISCVQLYKEAVDDNLIDALKLCPDRHMKNSCNPPCKGGSICNQITRKCVCPSYVNRFVTSTCSNALISTVYNEYVQYISFDNRTELPGNFYRNISEAKDRFSQGSEVFGNPVFVFVPGPVNSAMCSVVHHGTILPVPADSCWIGSNCISGATIAFWILVPPVKNWMVTGNATLIKYGNLEISYGLVNDMRNGTTRPIASLMFSLMGSSEKCLWVSMIYGSMLTEAWSHIALTVDASHTLLNVYFDGKENMITRDPCKPSEAGVGSGSTFTTGTLEFTCLDEVINWNRILPPKEIEGIYNATVFGGQQAVRSKIEFRSLVVREPDDLWALDKTNVLYKYHNASWIPLPGLRIRHAASGVAGVFAVMWDNKLYRRSDISVDNPEGKNWEIIFLSSTFQGPIIQLETTVHGLLHAETNYSWYCVDTKTKDDAKQLQQVLATNGKPVTYTSLSCTISRCWRLNGNRLVAALQVNSACNVQNIDPKYRDPISSNIGSSFFSKGPLIIREPDGRLSMQKDKFDRAGTHWRETYSKIKYSDVFGLNGQAVGITEQGDVELIKEGGYPFLIKPVADDSLCLKRMPDNSVISLQLSCTELFVYRDNFCLHHLETDSTVSFGPNSINTKDSECTTDDKVKINSNGTMTLLNDESKCVVGCTTINCWLTLSSVHPNKPCVVFSFFTVSSIKSIPGHRLIWNGTKLENSDVEINIKVKFILTNPKWNDGMALPTEPRFRFFCAKVHNEMQQTFAGNINFKGVHCVNFKNEKCSELAIDKCIFGMSARLNFAHIDEETRQLLFSSKMSDRVSDCDGIMCTISVLRKTVGVDFNPHEIEVMNITSTTCTLRVTSSIPYASPDAGYRVTLIGRSATEENLETLYTEFVSRQGKTIVVNQLAPYFNYTCTVSPLFLQGFGHATTVEFQTEGQGPSGVAGINITAIERRGINFTIIKISPKLWHGPQVGYRVYYQSVLKLDLPINLTVHSIEKTHEHINFTIDLDFSEDVAIQGLDVFTNYSILVAAYNGQGAGPLTHIFWRTSQGEPEVPPNDFSIQGVNSTHLNAAWSHINDIELLNGWYVSNYTLYYEEYNQPTITEPANRTIIVQPDQQNFTIGPLNPWRDYKVKIAANVESRPGVFASLCIRTDEDVPTEAPSISNITGYTAWSLNHTTGCLNSTNERGRIVYYNVSVMNLNASIEAFYIANITNSSCIAHPSCSYSAAEDCPSQVSGNGLKAFHLTSRNCSENKTTILRTSNTVHHTMEGLPFWTYYNISTAACTQKGCGPFSKPYTVRSDEHPPTCAPNVTAVFSNSSTSLIAAWESIPVSCAHGVVLKYNVFVTLAGKITGDECFNSSSCWPNKTVGTTKFYTMTEISTSELTDLKKYTEYCVYVQAVNSKGRGPASMGYCNYTAEEAPEGPPSVFKVSVGSSRSLKVRLKIPAPDVVNGIIRGYEVFYNKTDEAGNAIGNETKIIWKTRARNTTVKKIKELDEFTWYSLTSRAFTAIGHGPKSSRRRLRTFEDVPSGPPRFLNTVNVTEESFAVMFQQTIPPDLNGIFTQFKFELSEICRNDSVFEYEFFALAANISSSSKEEPLHNETSRNSSVAPFTRRRRNIDLPDSSITPPTLAPVINVIDQGLNMLNETVKDVSGTIDGTISLTSNLNGVLDFGDSLKSNITAAIAHINKTYITSAGTTRVRFDFQHTSFGIVISGLIPYTVYNISIATCNSMGCGPTAHWDTRTNQSIPSGSPQPTGAEATEDKLIVTWDDLPVMKTRGLITGYKVKWMKNCEYLRMVYLPLTEDCARIIPENTTTFLEQEVEHGTNNASLSDLQPFTWYRCEFCAKNIKGYGPCINTTYRTDESTPCQAPNVTSSVPVTGRSFRIDWQDVELICQRGIIIGYSIFYRLTHDSSYTDYEMVNTTDNFVLIDDLALKSNYTLTISAYTSKGRGVNSTTFQAMTGDFKHGNWSEWGRWSYCSKSCGGGTSTRFRTCTNPVPFNGGDDCVGLSNQTNSCNKQQCSGPMTGKLSESCSIACKAVKMYCEPLMKQEDPMEMYAKGKSPCNDSTSNPRYSELYHPSYVQNIGRCEGFLELPRLINCSASPPDDGQTVRLCHCVSSADCGCEEWTEWSVCSKRECGGGVQRRRRQCLDRQYCASGLSAQSTECNVNPCPVDGNWGEWSEISPCNKSCGFGYRHRYRGCENPAPQHNGRNCTGPSVDVMPECNIHECPVNGNWGNWGEWRGCDRACGGGLSIRKRYCDNPAPRYNGRSCDGLDFEGEPCNNHKCEGVEVRFAVKLVDFEWDYHLIYNNHPMAVVLAEEVRKNVRAVYNYSSVVNDVHILNFIKGSVVVNFTIFYSHVAQSEVLLLQDYISTTGRLYNLSAVLQESDPVEVVADPPSTLTATSISPTTINVTWKPPDDLNKVTNASGYFVFYRAVNGAIGMWSIAGVPSLNTTTFLLRDLKPFERYRMRMTLAVRTGNGPASDEVIQQTKEGVPSATPSRLTITAITASQIYVNWRSIGISEYQGRPLGYAVKYKEYFSPEYIEVRVPSDVLEATISNFKPFTLYKIEVSAVSGGGYGLPVSGNVKMPEGAPSVKPGAFNVVHGLSTSFMEATWNAIPDEAANGILLGYKLKYTITHVSDQPVVGAQITKELVLDKYTFYYKLTGLQSYTTYSVSVSGYTAGGEGPYATPISAMTCKCPPIVFTNWYNSPPYVYKRADLIAAGFMHDLLQDMISASCGKCNKQASGVMHFRSRSGNSPMKMNEEKVKMAIGEEYHISYPVFGSASITQYMDKHVFVLFVQSAGSATVVKHVIDYSAKTLNAFKSIVNIWPMYLIVICLTMVAGIVIWSLERIGNDEFSKGHYFSGIFQGFWWAFISMTTVGYGDITPRTTPGRAIAIVWTLAGLILTGILTGSLTSSVTTMTMPPPVVLYGTQSAAINNSYEYNLAVRRNSKVNTKRQYATIDEVMDAVKREEVKIGILDGFIVAEMANKLIAKSLKVSRTINGNNGYGVVLSNEFVRLESDFRSFIASRRKQIASFTANMTEKLYMAQSDDAEEIPLLFDPSTEIFWEMIYTECILIAVFSFLGICFSTYRSRKEKRKILPENRVQLLQMESVDSMVANFEGGLYEKFDSLGRKHESETLELVRVKLSYQRLLKRRYPDSQVPSESKGEARLGIEDATVAESST